MPVTVRRAVVTRAGAAEAVGPGQRSARSDRRGAEVLDVISVSPVPDGPFGQVRPYGPVDGRVNGVVHQLPSRTPSSIHQFCTGVDISWTSTPELRLPSRPSRTFRVVGDSPTSPRSAPRNNGRRGRATPRQRPRAGPGRRHRTRPARDPAAPLAG